MSEPARSGSHMSAIADVREKRGSTWMIVAPRSRAFITHRKADRDGSPPSTSP